MNLTWHKTPSGERSEAVNKVLNWTVDEKAGGYFAELNGFQYLTNPIGYVITNPGHHYIATHIRAYPQQDCESHASAIQDAIQRDEVRVKLIDKIKEADYALMEYGAHGVSGARVALEQALALHNASLKKEKE